MSHIQMTTLDSGLRVITNRVDTIYSVALGAWIGVGTRFEDMRHNGIAHMVEHMMFKGTKNRNALQIVQEIEDVGGHMNAYTSREVTSYHMHVLKDDVRTAMNVLSDMLQHSVMPDDEIDRERHVILQEIGMCTDTPDDLIFDKYYETAYPGQALGAPILGTSDIVQNMGKKTMMDYVRHFYTPDMTVISASGYVDHDEFVALVKSSFQDLPDNQSYDVKDADYKGGEIRIDKDLEQSHIIMGFQGVSRKDDDYYAAQALSTFLGGGMSSRLFQEVREKRGLVYSIFSFHSAYNDDGQFGIYAGTGPNDLEELIPVICDEVAHVSDHIGDEEVERVKAQMKASLLMSRESMMTCADQQAKFLLLRDKVLDIDIIIERIDAINKSKLCDVGARMFKTTPTLAALGPLQKLESFDSIKGRLQ